MTLVCVVIWCADVAERAVSVVVSVSHWDARAAVVSAHCTETSRVTGRNTHSQHKSCSLCQGQFIITSCRGLVFIVPGKLGCRWSILV